MLYHYSDCADGSWSPHPGLLYANTAALLTRRPCAPFTATLPDGDHMAYVAAYSSHSRAIVFAIAFAAARSHFTFRPRTSRNTVRSHDPRRDQLFVIARTPPGVPR